MKTTKTGNYSKLLLILIMVLSIPTISGVGGSSNRNGSSNSLSRVAVTAVGNTYDRIAIRAMTADFGSGLYNQYRMPAPPLKSGLAPLQGVFQVVEWVYSGCPGATEWPTDAKNAFLYALDILSSKINTRVPILIDTCWYQRPDNSLAVASSSMVSTNPGNISDDYLYPESLLETILGQDVYNAAGGWDSDIHIEVNSVQPWYFGTDGNTPSDKYDLVTVVMHEVVHGLGLIGSLRTEWSADSNVCDGIIGHGCWGWNWYPIGIPFAYLYDTHIVDSQGRHLTNQSVYPNPGQELGDAFNDSSGGLYFEGLHANQENGGEPVQLNNNCFPHLADKYYGTPDSLMTSGTGIGQSIHDLGPVTIGILEDLGWTVNIGDGPDLGISGFTTGIPSRQYTFAAIFGASTVTLPVTYTWTATGQPPVTHSNSGATDTITWSWTDTGVKTITVTASNADGIFMDTQEISISKGVPKPPTETPKPPTATPITPTATRVSPTATPMISRDSLFLPLLTAGE